jgi:hypothetical protein
MLSEHIFQKPKIKTLKIARAEKFHHQLPPSIRYIETVVWEKRK